MYEYHYKDCFIQYKGDILSIGNARIIREIEFQNQYPITNKIINVVTNYNWCEECQETASFNIANVNFEESQIEVIATEKDHNGLSESFLNVEILFYQKDQTVKWVFELFPELPFITSKLYCRGKKGIPLDTEARSNYNISTGVELMDQQKKDVNPLPDPDTIESFTIKPKHIKLKTIQFSDVTDKEDTLVRSSHQMLYWTGDRTYTGSAFLFDKYLESEQLLLVREGVLAKTLYDHQDELRVKESLIEVKGSGLRIGDLSDEYDTPCYGCTIGLAHQKDLMRLYKNYYTNQYKGDFNRKLFIMSNTWGDRNQDKAVCEEFIMNELEAGKEIGIDVLQIDDGWQKGVTANSALAKGGVWEGYYTFDSHFWEVNMGKFPNGLENVVQSAKEKGILLALWFSPDSSHNFANWQKDARVLLNLYERYDIRYYKFDGIKIKNKQSEMNFINLMTVVSKESNNKVSFNLDITAEVRFGYFYEKQFGTIFVENRYTDWVNYYPHNTLKNLWQLSEMIPSRKLQFEFLNIERNTERYGEDILAPSHYSIDYVFAITMFANPLAWMELSNLSNENKKLLSKIVKVYNQEKENLFQSEIIPLGNIPDGISFTGFQAITNEKEGYFLLFREFTISNQYSYQLYDVDNINIKIQKLYSNADLSQIDLGMSEDHQLRITMPTERSFLLASYCICE